MPDQEKLLTAIDAYAEGALGSHNDGGELARQRGLALDAYAGKNIEPAPEGRSQVVDYAVFETVNWILPSIMRIFAPGDGDNIVEFDPQNEEDEDSAKQESDYLNYVVCQRNDWELTVREFVLDALITKNAYCMVQMEEKYCPELERYEGQSEEQVALLMEDDDLEVTGQNQYDDPDDEGTVVDPTTGQPVQDEQQLINALALYQEAGAEPVIQRRQLFDIEVRRVRPEKSLKFQVLPPERVRVAQNTPDFTLDDCDYFEFWDAVTISELRKLGYDIPDDIDLEDPMFDTDTVEDEARNEVLMQDPDLDDMDDPALKEVICRWIWLKHDYDEDGIAELQHVVRVGRRIFEREEVSTIPVGCIVPFINTHRHMGSSVADLVFDIQRIKTAMLRAGLDSLNLSLNPRHSISTSVNIDDMLTSRPGSLVRLKNGAIPGEGHILPLPTEFVFPQAQEGLRHMDTVIEARVGVNRIFQGIDESALNDHNRIGQLSTMAAQRVEDIARCFGIGFKRLFKIAHELILKSGHSAETVRLRGQWVTVDPTQWKTGRDMRVTAPYAAGNKDALLQRLMVVKSIMAEALANGLPIATPEDAYELALEIAKAADTAGDKFFTHPDQIEPPPEGPDHTMIALEIENKKADTQDKEVEIDAELDKYKADLDAEVEKYKADLDAEVRRLIAQANQETQVLLAQLKAGQQIDLEQVKAKLKDDPLNKIKDVTSDAVSNLNFTVAESIEAVTAALAELKAQSEAPIEIVRENGKITGKRVNGKFIPLRDAT